MMASVKTIALVLCHQTTLRDRGTPNASFRDKLVGEIPRAFSQAF